MSQDSKTTPLQETDPHPLESPARESLQSNLDAKLSLRKKRSWFGNLRDVLHKGARNLMAPLAETDQTIEVTTPDLEAGQGRPSVESSVSLFSFRKVQTMPSRHALSTIRRHMPGRKKRNSIYSLISDRDATKEDANGQSSPTKQTVAPPGHRRHASLASSIRGSVRAVGCRAPAPASTSSPTKIATQIPLPSSPIDIPTLAPELSLDLGPSYLMPADFGASFDVDTDPALLGKTGRPRDVNTFLPVVPSTTAAELVQSPKFDLSAPPPYEPTTPMPGTNFGFDFDGSPAEKLLERDVETPPSVDGKRGCGIRPMRSIDAIAEAFRHKEQVPDTTGQGGVASRPAKVVDSTALVTLTGTTHGNTDSMHPGEAKIQDWRPISMKTSDSSSKLDPTQQIAHNNSLEPPKSPSPLRITKAHLKNPIAKETSQHDGTAKLEQDQDGSLSIRDKGVPSAASASETSSGITDYVEFKTQHLFGDNAEEESTAEYYDNEDVATPVSSGLSSPPGSLTSSIRVNNSDHVDSMPGSDRDGLSWQYEIHDSDSSGSIFLARVLQRSTEASDDSLDSISLASELEARQPYRATLESPRDTNAEQAQHTVTCPVHSAVPANFIQTRSPGRIRLDGSNAELDTLAPDPPRKRQDSMIVSLQDAVLDINKLQKHLDELSKFQNDSSNDAGQSRVQGRSDFYGQENIVSEIDIDTDELGRAGKGKVVGQAVRQIERRALGDRSNNV